MTGRGRRYRVAVWFHRGSAVVWLALTVPAYLWWRGSVLFVIVASVYANVKSDWGAAEAADNSAVTELIAAVEHRLDERLDRIERRLDEQQTRRSAG